MELSELMDERVMRLSMSASTKSEAIDELIGVLDENGVVADKLKLKQAVLAREAEYATSFGLGVAIPHAKSDAALRSAIAFGKTDKGLIWSDSDPEPVYMFFMIVVPEQARQEHLRLLAKLSRKLAHEEIRAQILQSKTADEIIAVLS